MTTNMLILIIALAWPLSAIILGVIIGHAIRYADRRVSIDIDQSIDAAIRRILDAAEPDDDEPAA